MKLIESWLQINEMTKEPNLDVILCKMYMDQFGKIHIQSDIFDTFTLRKQVYDNKEMLCRQAKNIVLNFNGFKL